MYTIYQITCKVNGKKYFGLTTVSTRTRWIQHKSEARRGSIAHFHKAIRKYGEDVWKVEVVTTTDNVECASYIEDNCIQQYNTIQEGYNSCGGGYHNTKQSGYKHTPQALAKITEISKSKMRKIFQFDASGRFIKEWSSARDAAREIYGAAATSSNITKCANQYLGQVYVNKSGYPPYAFKFDKTPPPPREEVHLGRVTRSSVTRGKAVVQIDQHTNSVINTWSSAAAAARALGLQPSSIYRVIRGELSQTGGFVFKLSSTDTISE